MKWTTKALKKHNSNKSNEPVKARITEISYFQIHKANSLSNQLKKRTNKNTIQKRTKKCLIEQPSTTVKTLLQSGILKIAKLRFRMLLSIKKKAKAPTFLPSLNKNHKNKNDKSPSSANLHQ